MLGITARYGPEGILRVPVQKTADFRSCSSSTRSLTFLFVPLKQILMVQAVQQTTEIPLMPFVLRSSMPLLCRSCGSTSPFDRKHHRCHCSCRDFVLFVGRRPCCRSVYVAMSCGGSFIPGGAYDSVWDSVKPKTGKFVVHLFPVPRVRRVCVHAE